MQRATGKRGRGGRGVQRSEMRCLCAVPCRPRASRPRCSAPLCSALLCVRLLAPCSVRRRARGRGRGEGGARRRGTDTHTAAAARRSSSPLPSPPRLASPFLSLPLSSPLCVNSRALLWQEGGKRKGNVENIVHHCLCLRRSHCSLVCGSFCVAGLFAFPIGLSKLHGTEGGMMETE
jgi:hypothetical protein